MGGLSHITRYLKWEWVVVNGCKIQDSICVWTLGTGKIVLVVSEKENYETNLKVKTESSILTSLRLKSLLHISVKYMDERKEW